MNYNQKEQKNLQKYIKIFLVTICFTDIFIVVILALLFGADSMYIFICITYTYIFTLSIHVYVYIHNTCMNNHFLVFLIAQYPILYYSFTLSCVFSHTHI